MKLKQYHSTRKIIQLATLLLIALILVPGLFRVDLASASFFILGYQVWWSNFFFISGLTLVFITVPIITYMTIGSAWCGWACPQNLLTEWANDLTYKLLGKRADVRVDGKGMVVAASKNKIANWILLGSIFMAVSIVLALIPFFFFYSPHDVWNFIFAGSRQDVNVYVMYVFAVFLIFIDIAFIRYFLCDYACFYRMGHKMFKAKEALHVSYDASRSAECSKCNFCAASCITDIQPTRIEAYDNCIDCGECVDACNRLHSGSAMPGLLSFESGAKHDATWAEKLGIVFSRFNLLAGAFLVAGIAMMIWGIYTQERIPHIPLAQQLKERALVNQCNRQCEPQQVACRKGSMEQCYRAAACKCECFLQQDPANVSGGEWRQCVQRNTTSAEKLALHGKQRP